MNYYYTYIMANEYNNVFYVGFTGNLERRISEHKQGIYGSAFTKKYNVKKLVYYEATTSAIEAINKEKQIKKWSRQKKIELIERFNPQWKEIEIFE